MKRVLSIDPNYNVLILRYDVMTGGSPDSLDATAGPMFIQCNLERSILGFPQAVWSVHDDDHFSILDRGDLLKLTL